jgi:hypothetical protein
MIDLDRLRGVRAANERDRLTGVTIDQDTALRVAGARPDDQLREVAAQDVVTGIATVVAELDVDVVAPRFAEAVAGEVGLPIPALDGKRRQLGPRVVVVG